MIVKNRKMHYISLSQRIREAVKWKLKNQQQVLARSTDSNVVIPTKIEE